jgi:pimeloyl-ACP methyl ester carboxylesterase
MPQIDVGGVQTYHEEYGQGDPVKLLHGGLESGADWSPLGRAFADRYRVLATRPARAWADSRAAARYAVPERIPNSRAAYDAVATTARGVGSPLPPTTTSCRACRTCSRFLFRSGSGRDRWFRAACRHR